MRTILRGFVYTITAIVTVFIVVMVLAMVIGGAQHSQDQAAADQADTQMMPDDEKAFVAAVLDARAKYRAAANEMAQGALRPARATVVCAIFGTRRTANNWLGTVEKLSSNNDGKGVLSVRIADDLHLMTWNNSLSDISDHTLIEPGSALFVAASSLKERQKVTFSGTFIASDVDCVREGSITLSGSMTEPDYVMRFQRIAAR
jgi:hypothetical protein